MQPETFPLAPPAPLPEPRPPEGAPVRQRAREGWWQRRTGNAGRKEDALAEEKTSMLLHMSQAFPCPSPFDSTRGDVANVCVCRDVPPTRMYAAVRQEAEDLWNSHCKITPRMQKAALAAEREELRRQAQDETQREEPLRRGYEACCTRDMPLANFLPDVGAAKMASKCFCGHAGVPRVLACQYPPSASLLLRAQGKRHKSSREDVAVGHANNMSEAERFS